MKVAVSNEWVDNIIDEYKSVHKNTIRMYDIINSCKSQVVINGAKILRERKFERL